MEGCLAVTIAGQVVEATGLEGATVVPDQAADDALDGGGGVAKKKPSGRLQGELATDTIIVESKGGKAIWRNKAGKKSEG